jgi:hypothetical protein
MHIHPVAIHPTKLDFVRSDLFWAPLHPITELGPTIIQTLGGTPKSQMSPELVLIPKR